MRPITKALAAAFVAAAVPLLAGPVAAAPLSQTPTLHAADVGTVENVQYRRYGNRWVGPSAAYPYAYYGYDDGYYAYGAVPGPAYGYTPGGWGYSPQAPSPGSSPHCTADREQNSSFPSWMCR
jgi:hypothetical protein